MMALAAVGYSGTPLPAKLGLKDGQKSLFVGLPETLSNLKTSRAFFEVRDAAAGALDGAGREYDLVHFFTDSRAELEAAIPALKKAIVPNGAIWISWPKKASKIPTDITEDVIRDVVLPIGLVDVKVCAVDAVWSGLKLVIRKELRAVSCPAAARN